MVRVEEVDALLLTADGMATPVRIVSMTQPPLLQRDDAATYATAQPRQLDAPPLRIELEWAELPRLDTLERQLAWAVLRGGRVAALTLRDRLTETDGAGL